ncbi:MAG: hypothetical protein ACYDDF_02190 [Thermoplasmatota archaeon]
MEDEAARLRQIDAALGQGDIGRARALTQAALEAHPSKADSASSDSLSSDSTPSQPPDRAGDPYREEYGPRGRHQGTGEIFLLAVVTLGLYMPFYFWRVSTEVDAFTRGRARALDAYAPALLLWVVGVIINGFLGVAALNSRSMAGYAAPSMGDALLPAMIGAMTFGIGLVAAWRVWTAIEGAETDLRIIPTTSPSALLTLAVVGEGLSALATLIGGSEPMLTIIVGLASTGVFLAVVHGMQTGLNQLWSGAVARPSGDPSWEPTFRGSRESSIAYVDSLRGRV